MVWGLTILSGCGGGGGGSTPAPTPSNPEAGLSPGALTYAGQPIGTTSASQSVTLSNTGAAALSITSIAVTAGASDFTETNTCGGSVAVSGTCTISVTFDPSATGTRSGTLTVTDNSGEVAASTQTVSLMGTGLKTPTPTFPK